MHLCENNSYPASDEIWVVLLVFHDVDPVEDQVVLPGLRIQDGKQHAYYERPTLSRSQSLSCNSSRACSIPWREIFRHAA